MMKSAGSILKAYDILETMSLILPFATMITARLAGHAGPGSAGG